MKRYSIAQAAKFCLLLLPALLLSVSAVAGDTLSLSFTGDILLDRGVRQFIRIKGADGLFSKSIDSLFNHSKIVIGNLECPATKIEAPMFKRYIFRAEPEWLEVLHRHGFTHLNLANNHSIDQGRDGLIDTQQNIIRAGMIPIGAGENMEEAAYPIILAVQPRKVYLVTSLQMALENFDYLTNKPCVSQESFDSLLRRIKVLRQNEPNSYIIVTLHWGMEHTLKAMPYQRQEAHQIIDAGANCIVGHHPHAMQNVETYKNCKIYYSIGNFIFDQTKPINTNACVVNIKISETSAKVTTIPIKIEKCVPLVCQFIFQ